MVIPADADWCRDDGANGVYSLEGAIDVSAASDLLDQDWCQAFRAEFLVDAEEVDFDHFEGFAADVDGDGDTADRGD